MSDDGDLRVRADLVVPADELVVSMSRAGGPGGQNVNKVATRVTLRWCLTTSAAPTDAQRERLATRLAPRLTRDGELVLHADRTRSQSTNRREARERLVEILREALHVPKTRRATKPTRGSKRRRVATKRQRSETKRLRGKPRGEE